MSDDLPAGGAAAPAPPADVAAATARRAELMNDPGFRDRYLSGSIEARTEIAALSAQLVAGAASETSVADQFTIERAREMGCSPEVIEQIKAKTPVAMEEMERVAAWKRGHLADKSWTQKYLAGDLQARREMLIANHILSSPIKPNAA